MPLRQIDFDLRCVRCRYNLRGLAAMALCPECGTPVVASIVAADDPVARRMVALAHPMRVGVSLIVATTALGVGFAVSVGPDLVRAVAGLEALSHPRTGVDQAAAIGALVLFGIAAAASIVLSRERTSLYRAELASTRTPLWVGPVVLAIAAALRAWGLLAPSVPFKMQPVGWGLICAAVGLLGACLGTVGLRRLIVTLGRRSRNYRRGRHGRQSIDLLLAAAVLQLAAATGAVILNRLDSAEHEALANGALALVVALTLILAIGLAYLILNACWIGAAIARQARDHRFDNA